MACLLGDLLAYRQIGLLTYWLYVSERRSEVAGASQSSTHASPLGTIALQLFGRVYLSLARMNWARKRVMFSLSVGESAKRRKRRRRKHNSMKDIMTNQNS